jgi:Rps23 Pro-64 3,4-dihydroxylase Tpa1-like proline 4-hydroxylase
METTPKNQMMIYPITEGGLDFLHIKNIPDSLLDDVRKEFEVAKNFMYFDDKKGGAAHNDTGGYKRTGGAILAHDIFHPHFVEHTASVQYTVKMRKIILSNLWPVPPFSHINYFRYPEQVIINYAGYRNGEEYKAHWDLGTLTLITWLSDHNEFSGGEIVFPEFDNYTIKPEKNSAILFPSHYQHEVRKVITDSDELVRYTFSAFFHTLDPREAVKQRPIKKRPTNDEC